jgi:putative oxidoreductase
MMPMQLTKRDYALLWLRVGVGGMVFALHGWARIFRVYNYLVLGQTWSFVGLVHRIGFPAPGFFAVASAAADSLGAALLIAGLFTRWSAAIMAFNMAVAVYFELSKGGSGAELPGVYLAAVLAVLLGGPGAFSVDEVLSRRKRKAGAAEPVAPGVATGAAR